jgi:pentatricopeptide repeat protein
MAKVSIFPTRFECRFSSSPLVSSVDFQSSPLVSSVDFQSSPPVSSVVFQAYGLANDIVRAIAVLDEMVESNVTPTKVDTSSPLETSVVYIFSTRNECNLTTSPLETSAFQHLPHSKRV